MSNFAQEQQEKYANSLVTWYCNDCQDEAILQAWQELKERSSLVSAFAIAGIALDILQMDGTVKPCTHDCANSGSMVTMRKIAERAPMPKCGHIICEDAEGCTFSDPDTYHEYGPYAGV